MPVFLGGTPLHTAKIGSDQVKKIYVGSAEVWSDVPPFARQRINKTSGTNVTSGYIGGWVSDSTFPGVVGTGDTSLVVAGSGTKAYVRTLLSTNSSMNGEFYLRVNGANVQPDVLTGASTSMGGQYSVDLVSGDELSLWTSISSTGSQTAADGYIEVVPAGVVGFDSSATAFNSSSSTSATITTAENATILISADVTPNSVRVDGVNATRIDNTVVGTCQVWYMHGLSAGDHTVTITSGFGATFIAHSYTGVTAVGTGNISGSAFTSSKTMVATGGAGQLCVSTFNGSGIGDPGTTSTGTVRDRVKNTSNNGKSLLVSTDPGDTNTANLSSAGSIAANAVWLY